MTSHKTTMKKFTSLESAAGFVTVTFCSTAVATPISPNCAICFAINYSRSQFNSPHGSMKSTKNSRSTVVLKSLTLLTPHVELKSTRT
ncbi:hypothetical protein V6N13_109327 [Hibiscus sabdariffa]